MMRQRLNRILAFGVAFALIAGPVLAYTVFLKDGSSIVAKEKYRVDGDRVIITLPSGNETFLPLEEVDLEKTNAFNAQNLGGAVLIEDGKVKGVPSETPQQQTTLGDLIASGQARPRSRAEARRQTRPEPAAPQKTTAGYLDFSTIRRQAYGDLEFMSELRSYFTSQGLEAQIFRGTQSDRPLVQVVTGSESAVFKSLQVAAQAMAQLADRHAARLNGLELLMQTSRGTLAGQFVLTPDLASQINSNSVDVATFFIENVQF